MNTFVTTGDRPVLIIWKGITLSKDEFDTLKVILDTLHYLGRAESRCVVTISTITNVKPNCIPFDRNDQLSTDHNLVSVLTPIKNVEFVDMLNQPSSKKTHNLKSITITTGQLHEKNYQYPPGAKLLYYTLPRNCFEPEITHSTNTDQMAAPVGGLANMIRPEITHSTNTDQMSSIKLVRYAVVGAVRPSISDTMRVADTARSACMSLYGKYKNNNVSRTFSGKDGDGKPLVDHVHAFYLPTYETQNKTIDHLTIITKNGFNVHELNVLFELKNLYRYNQNDIQLVFEGCGIMDNFDMPILGESKIWTSATPLVLTRHMKYRGSGKDRLCINGPAEQVRNELSIRYGPTHDLESITVDSSYTNINNTNLKPLDFYRWRRRGRVGSDTAYNVKLKFKKTVRGPLTLGYGSHFGLGMFVPYRG